MTQAVSVQEIFADAREVYDQAIRRLEEGDVRDAAEKAWCAAKRATDALILSRTGRLPEFTAETTRGLMGLATASPDYATLVGRYYSRIGHLHGACFYEGICDPIPETERRIRETSQYVDDAERLAYS